jgi:hypothetical protein
MKNIPERKIPFQFSSCGLPNIQDLDPLAFVRELKDIPSAERMAMVRSYIQDRSPAAFSSAPYLWEAVREWIAKRHLISPRQIGLAGSAQIGFSTNPKKAFAPFNKNGSDLDLYIVSEHLFTKMEREALLFVSRQSAVAKSDFKDQAETTTRTLRRGYIDLQFIPAIHERYPVCANLLNDTSIVIDKLKLSGYNLKRSHFRVYKNWESKATWTSLQAKSWAENLPLRVDAELR